MRSAIIILMAAIGTDITHGLRSDAINCPHGFVWKTLPCLAIGESSKTLTADLLPSGNPLDSDYCDDYAGCKTACENNENCTSIVSGDIKSDDWRCNPGALHRCHLKWLSFPKDYLTLNDDDDPENETMCDPTAEQQKRISLGGGNWRNGTGKANGQENWITEFRVCKPAPLARDDPHGTNLRGEQFDITASGLHNLLHFPRGEATKFLSVEASVRRLGRAACEATFIEMVSVEGSWLHDTPKLKFSAGTLKKPSPFTADAEGLSKWKHSEVLKSMECIRLADGLVGLCASKNDMKDAKIASFSLIFSVLTIEIQNVQHKHYGYLNFDARGLSRVHGEIGGILGLDNHVQATIVPSFCQRKNSKLQQVNNILVRSSLNASY